MGKSNVEINIDAHVEDGRLSRLSKLFSEASVSSYESDSSTEDLGIKPLKSTFLSHRTRPTTALACKDRPNLSATTQLTKKHLKVIRTLKKELQDEDLSWIKDTFNRKDCVNYIDDNGVCHCGRKEHDHIELNKTTPGTAWNDMQHCNILPTDAFGRVKLVSGGYNTARYLRLSNDSECDDILKLLKDFWHLNMPGIVLSLIGSGFTSIPHKLHQIIQRDLAKVGKLTRAWILSKGISCGVSSIVGQMLSTHGYPVPAIAFCSWGKISGSSSLKFSEDDPDALIQYLTESNDADKCLDSNHTHFLLVDDGTIKDTMCDDKLRNEFERYLSSKFNIPLLYIVIGGTESDGVYLHHLLKFGSTIVLVRGSGGFADDYCDFHKHLEEQIEVIDQCSCFKGSPCNEIVEKMDHDFDITILHNVWSNKDKLSIYDYTDVSDFDTFILKLLVSTTTDCNIDDQLDLACKWSRLDVAEHVLSAQLDATTGAKYSNGLTKTLFHALLWGHAEFCGVLIENGADIYDIQANLVHLYEAAYFSPRSSHVIQLLEKYSSFGGTSSIRMNHVNELLDRLIGRGYSACSGYEVDPYYELTLWACLMLRADLAMLLWRYTQDPVRCALVATLMLYSLKHNAYLERDDDRRRTKEMYETFEELALCVLDQAWLSDSETCKRAMLSKWARIRSYNYLDIAFHSHARKFMSHPACQELISAGWRGQFKRDTSFIRILLIIVIPPLCITPLVPFDRKVSYRRAIQGRYKMIYIDKLQGAEALYNRALAFYTAPVTKFWMNIMFYFAFLCFHTYTLLYKMKYISSFDLTQLTWTEIIVWFWLGTMLVSESIDWIESCYNKHTKLRYLNDSWNRMDIIIIFFYILGLIFRIMDDVSWFQAGRTILACNTVIMFMKLLMLLEYKPSLGPILLMLREMSKDLGVFVLLLGIFLMGFGIAYVALLIPPDRMSWTSLSALFVYPYFQMFGDFYLDVFEGSETHDSDSSYIDRDWEAGPNADVSKYQGLAAVALLCFWLMLSTVMLVNLLIAMFSDTYRCIKDNQVIIWKYQRYKMLSQYRASFIPPPFTFLHYLLRGIVKLVRYCSRRAVQPSNTGATYYWKDCMIRTFMQDARDEYLSIHDTSNDSSEILTKLQSVEQHLKIIRRVGNRASSLYA